MAEYIERYTLLQKLYDLESDTGYSAIGWTSLHNVVAKQPAADVAPVRHGRWETYLDGDRLMPEQYYKCSICGDRGYRFRGNYCPNCGAKMDGGVDGG